jgi:hypothetical protein
LPKNDTNEQNCRVYSDHREHVGCFDFNVDENGVWVIYRNGSRNHIYVSKLNIDDLSIQKTVVIKFVENGEISNQKQYKKQHYEKYKDKILQVNKEYRLRKKLENTI